MNPPRMLHHKGHKGHRARLAGFLLCVLCVLCGETAGILLAQAPDFSGTWKLNRTASRIAGGTGIAGLGAGGAPNTLYVSQAANGTVIVGSDVNESHARTFKAGGGAIAHETGAVKELLTLSADRQTLTLKVTAGELTSTLVYTKVQSEDPCEKWPTPCRDSTGSGSRF